MRVFMTGGTGFAGRYICGRLSELGHSVTVITRSARKAQRLLPHAALLEGDPRQPGGWQSAAAGHDVIINLAGASIFTLWTAAARQSIIDSRVLTTRNLAGALAQGGKGKLLISASAVGYYGARLDDEILDETSPPGTDFSAEVCTKWEDEAVRAQEYGARVVRSRFGIVLGKGGGALSKMAPAFRYCAGGALGSGRQWFSWVHEEDLFQILMFAIEQAQISGPVNCTAPNPVRNRELATVLARSVHRPVFLPAVPAFMLRGLLGEFGDVVLKGQRAVPKKLLDAGFSFRFPTLQQALDNLLG
jgi:uncharacterized protein